jgi:peptide/nickel transport system ATP-binding protein
MLSNKSIVFSAKNISKTFGGGKKNTTAVNNVLLIFMTEKSFQSLVVLVVVKCTCKNNAWSLCSKQRQFHYNGKKITNLKKHWNDVQFCFPRSI